MSNVNAIIIKKRHDKTFVSNFSKLNYKSSINHLHESLIRI